MEAILQQVKDLISKSAFSNVGQLDVALSSAKTANSVPGLNRAASVRQLPDLQLVLYPNNQNAPEAVRELLIACGEMIWLTQKDDGKEIWKRKLIFDDSGTGAEFSEKLSTGKYSTYLSVVESFDGAVQRLIALHIANALIYNRIPCKDASKVNVLEWPQTSGISSGQVPFSLLPLLGAYCDSDCWESFPKAFAHQVLGSVKCSRKDVAEKLTEIVRTVSS